eukprot:TRINITY_DN9391_c0_g1_i1.p1 TRINITY_DN9391_c0_g1~~TRINITY_DN9391_c0_g1_i1.p1  ORF type:complete len:680 (-),score=100.18 TRINITY_DN9391_c0_g1_i1:26-2065(-)
MKWLFLFAVIPLVFGASFDYYISTTGNDNNSGNLNSPWLTIERAQQQVLTLKKNNNGLLPGPVNVQFLGGTYYLPKTIQFTKQDSGTASNRVTYAAADKQEVILSGGMRVTNWEKSPNSNIWIAHLPNVDHVRQLWYNGERRVMARSPLMYFESLPTDNANHFVYKAGQVESNYLNLKDVQVVIYHYWTASIHLMSSIDAANRIVYVSNPISGRFQGPASGNRFYIENAFEYLTSQQGFFYFNRQSHLLYYNAFNNENPNQNDVVIPMLTELLNAIGNPQTNDFIEYITLSGLSFQHTDADLSNCFSSTCDGQSASFLDTAVLRLNGANNWEFNQISVGHTGGTGLYLMQGCNDNVILSSHFYDLGAGAVRIGPGINGLTPQPVLLSSHNTLNNSLLEDGGYIYQMGTGVLLQQSTNNIVSNNEIRYFKYTGISAGWTWGYDETSVKSNYIAFNYIHHIGLGVLSDMGCIYTLGRQPGTHLFNNLCHDVVSYGYGGWGYYTDEGSSNITIQNNIVYHTKSAGIHQHYGTNNLFVNNIVAFPAILPCDESNCDEAAVRSSQHAPGSDKGQFSSFTFERNILLITNGTLFFSTNSIGFKNMTMDYNLYWSTTQNPQSLRFPPTQAPTVFSQWQSEGKDVHSIISDPLFVNPQGLDFSDLKPDSPAFKLGFVPISTKNIGPH